MGGWWVVIACLPDGRGREGGRVVWPHLNTRPPSLPLSQSTGAAILEALAAQRATLERSRARLDATDADLATSQRLLKRMASWWPPWGG